MFSQKTMQNTGRKGIVLGDLNCVHVSYIYNIIGEISFLCVVLTLILRMINYNDNLNELS